MLYPTAMLEFQVEKLKTDANIGYGLVYCVKGTDVFVQFGNTACTIDRQVLNSSYQAFGTGIPFLPEVSGVGETIIINTTRLKWRLSATF